MRPVSLQVPPEEVEKWEVWVCLTPDLPSPPGRVSPPTAPPDSGRRDTALGAEEPGAGEKPCRSRRKAGSRRTDGQRAGGHFLIVKKPFGLSVFTQLSQKGPNFAELSLSINAD